MTEVWKPVKGYENSYEVSNLGNVRSVDRIVEQKAKCGSTAKHLYKGKLLSPVHQADGYLTVNLSGKVIGVHRVVALTFLPNSDGKPYVNHIDGIKTNNRLDNLEWCTPQENTKHAFVHNLVNLNTKKKREQFDNCRAKADEKNRKRIAQYDTSGNFIKEYGSIAEASKSTGANVTHISLCAKGKQKTCGNYIWRYVI